MNNLLAILACVGVLMVSYSEAFSPLPLLERSVLPQSSSYTCSSSSSCLAMAGFGEKATKNQKKELKLKPKQQWDRYTSLKTEDIVRVAVRAKDDWLEVGKVKSKGNTNTAIAVAKQRVIIADHARRLYPLQVSKDAKVEWAYFDEAGSEWMTVDKSVLDGAADGVEKEIGFEGTADPASGFYCMYNQGRLVDTSGADSKSSNI